MDFAPIDDIPGGSQAPERFVERQRMLGTVKFMGLPQPFELVEPEPTLIAKFRSLLSRATGRPWAARP